MKSVGQEIMRVRDNDSGEVKALKSAFAKIFDHMTSIVMETQAKVEQGPAIVSEESVKQHMNTVVRQGDEQMRCMAESGKYLELACMWAIKGLEL